MLFISVIIIMFIGLLAVEIVFLKSCGKSYKEERKILHDKHILLEREEDVLKKEIGGVEKSLSEHFLFYDIARRMAPLLSRKDVFKVFTEEIRYLGKIDDIRFSDSSLKAQGYLKFKIGKEAGDALHIKTRSRAVIAYIPYFVKLLSLCLERVDLYEKLQEISIHDSLTKIYNRRYFMLRYLEEFERAKKFNLNLSFLMIDVDHFKKINDTYGHLVGDAVLREVAALIKENTREIDLIARYGGEEFSAILPETDKAGAIMMAERISSRISRRQIKVFDETLNLTISAGVAAFPQNTIHSDVLVEIADKALYKAKLSGRNRVCWF